MAKFKSDASIAAAMYAKEYGKQLETIRRLKKQIADERKRALEWGPIESAPRDGNHILLYRPEIRFVGYYAKAGWCISAPGLPKMDPPPTHWMPLPKMPKGQLAIMEDEGDERP